MGRSKYIIVTAADDAYLPLCLDLLRSLRRLQVSFAFDIGILDLGLSPSAKDQLSSFDVAIKPAGMDMDYPGRLAWEQRAPFYRAMTSRPYLRDYFPGYEAYQWMDSDSWAQNTQAIETMLPAAAADDSIYIACEFDRDYPPYFQGAQVFEYHLQWYKAHFPDDIVGRVFPRPMFNSGVMAMSPQSPVWDKWAETFKACLQRLPTLDRQNFMSEQLSLNVAIHVNNLPFKVMPSEFNWLSLYNLPMVDAVTGHYVRPTVPRNDISVIHLTHQQKLRLLDLKTTDGKTVQSDLTFSSYANSLNKN